MNGSQKTDFVTGLREAVRENPVSAVLVGMGIAWMFMGGSRITAAAALIGPTARAAADGVGRAVDLTSSAASSVTETARSASQRAATQASDLAASVVERGADVYEGSNRDTSESLSPMMTSLKTTFERQPLLLGGIGLALGSVIAAALPRTRMEADIAGEASDRVSEQVKEFAADATGQIKDAVTRASAAVKDEAEAQGLTVEGAKAGAAALKEKVVNVAAAPASTKVF